MNEVGEGELKKLRKLLNENDASLKVMARDYQNLIYPASGWYRVWLISELRKLQRLPGVPIEELKKKKDAPEFLKVHRKNFSLDRRTFRLLLIAAVMDESNNGSSDGSLPVFSGSTVGDNLTMLHDLLQLDSNFLREKLDDELKIAWGDDRNNIDFAEFEKLHEDEKHDVALHLGAIRTGNWAVLSAMYPEYIKPRDTIYAWTVNAADQSFRLRIAVYSTLAFLLVGLLANLNNMCLHGVYRDQLAAVWLPTGPLLLKDLNTCRQGGPLHLINATLNRHGAKLDPDSEGMARFVFSNRFCGSKRFGYRETWEYENGEIGLADAVAISGAAVSTSYVGDLLFRTLLFLTNFRLGQWVRNPKHFQEEHYWPSPLRVLISQLWHPTDRAYIDLTDGGHLDNTGLASLLERRCRIMILGDCSQDPDYNFEDLFSVLHDARAKYGIQVEEVTAEDDEHLVDRDSERCQSIDPLKLLIPDPARSYQSRAHFAIFRVRYPCSRAVSTGDESTAFENDMLNAVLIVIKPTLTGDEPVDLLAHRKLNDGFPNDATINQFLDPEDFESYVMLGRHIGEQLDQLLRDGGLDEYKLPSPWCSGKQVNEEIPDSSMTSPAAPVKTVKRDELPGRNVVGAILDAVQFDEPGIGVAIALVRQWAEAEWENDEALLSAKSEFFDNVIRQVMQWSKEHGENASLKRRRLFCSELINILEEHTWIHTEADDEIHHAFRDMLDWLGQGVSGAKEAAVTLART